MKDVPQLPWKLWRMVCTPNTFKGKPEDINLSGRQQKKCWRKMWPCHCILLAYSTVNLCRLVFIIFITELLKCLIYLLLFLLLCLTCLPPFLVFPEATCIVPLSSALLPSLPSSQSLYFPSLFCFNKFHLSQSSPWKSVELFCLSSLKVLNCSSFSYNEWMMVKHVHQLQDSKSKTMDLLTAMFFSKTTYLDQGWDKHSGKPVQGKSRTQSTI